MKIHRPQTAALLLLAACTQDGGEPGSSRKAPVNEPPAKVQVADRPGGLATVVLEPQAEAIDSVSELLLMFAARSLHLANLIEPALARGCWVLCDRFTDATEAYQGAGRGVPLEHIRALEKIAQRDRRPDLTLFLDAPVTVAFERTRRRAQTADRFESEDARFFERVRAGYLAILEREPARVARVDATGDQQTVSTAIARQLDLLLVRSRGAGGT